ncbi:hypothetical protein V8C43DRAFT_271423 [Trichoderma afarasin]
MWYVLLAPCSVQVLVQALGLLRVPTSCLRRPVAAYLLALYIGTVLARTEPTSNFRAISRHLDKRRSRVSYAFPCVSCNNHALLLVT